MTEQSTAILTLKGADQMNMHERRKVTSWLKGVINDLTDKQYKYAKRATWRLIKPTK